MAPSKSLPRVLTLLLAACGGGQIASPAEPTEISPEISEAPQNEYSASVASTPRAVLEGIRHEIAADNIEGVRDYVLDWGVGDEATPDMVIIGIRDRYRNGDWAYSPEALEVAIERADEFEAPNAELSAVLLREFGRFDPRLADPSKFLLFDDPSGTHLLMLEQDGVVQLVFWENLTGLVGVAPP